jgi:hypothetical protein
MAIPRLSKVPGAFTTSDIKNRYHYVDNNMLRTARARVRRGMLEELKVLALIPCGGGHKVEAVYAFRIPGATILDWNEIDSIFQRLAPGGGSMYLKDRPLIKQEASIKDYMKLWKLSYGTTSSCLTKLRADNILTTVKRGRYIPMELANV